MHNKSEQISELTQLNEDLENYFANTIIPQLFVDAQLTLRKFTPPAMKQFTLKNEYIGKPMEEIKENFRYPTIIENIKNVIATGKILEKEIQTIDMRWFQMNILPYIIRKENRTDGVIITFVDITSRIRDLKEQERMLAENELLLDTIAHDIKNPIHALGLTVQMIKKLTEGNMENFPFLMDSLEVSLLDMKKVVEDLVDSHWQRQRYQAAEELLDFQSILEDVRLTLSHQVLETGAVITHNINVPEITFVRRKLRSVLYNLLSNAIKYTPSERSPEINVCTEECNGYIVISVSDNGIGMSAEEQQLIFKKFQRLKTDTEGSGVGLYLVNTIVSSAGGKIEIESETGSGSVFRVYFKIDYEGDRKP
ncbi:GHKL domain-containing protein [Pedobacter psychrodurus]|uniref:histidine kinase n=1 Tax=Pedobacter psychrodurus TaxID=2530456 RepID=A0A4R0PVF2_9SPHI|nr:ATP-binding protein [Pedobacter psychrodurus]TCD26540.1 GHKL domain-containing protein [Pedobacter psychrodurus]